MFRRTRSTRRRLRGHSLLEAMLAGSILLIGLAGVVSALGSGQAINTHTRRLGSGVLVAERTMERLLLLPVGHSDLTTTSHTGPTYGVDASLDGSGPFTPSWTISAGPIDGSLRIDVTVTWSERGMSRTARMTSFR